MPSRHRTARDPSIDPKLIDTPTTIGYRRSEIRQNSYRLASRKQGMPALCCFQHAYQGAANTQTYIRRQEHDACSVKDVKSRWLGIP
jgi:hypothetical protein